MKAVPSPVDERFGAAYIEDFPTSDIRDGYLRTYQINIDPFIASDSLQCYRCEQTGLLFYRGITPGDGDFYSRLMAYDWYYDPWKWEHAQISGLLAPDDRILEIGCGAGGFLSGISKKVARADGIELNAEAVKSCRERGLSVEATDLKDFADQKPGQYDWVVTFQVMEHILDVGPFLRNAVRLLKPGGRLVISVPNNDAFIGRAVEDWLNMPPHHMNRWNAHSLKKVAPLIDCSFDRFLREPLQDYHRDWYVNTVLADSGEPIRRLPPGIRGIAYRLFRRVLGDWIAKDADNINGHTIIALYTKNAVEQ